jgi:acetyl esterase/lipase
VAIAPLTVVIVIGVLIGVFGSSDGFPAATVVPGDLPAGGVSTVEYCRPAGVPLAMDLYTPSASARTGRPAPVVLYVHGGGWTMGGRGLVGVGATLAAQDGALFPGLVATLTARGFVVASIDYRLAPDTPWPASIQDAKCAVRFLRAHAAELGIDPARIGAWGSSAGGQLVAMLGLAGPAAGFDVGQYREQSSTVQAVVDMFGPTDLTDFADANGFASAIAYLGMGDNPDTLHSASPVNYVTPAAPPFLILQGSDDKRILPRQSQHLSDQLHAAGVRATLIMVAGTGHTVNTPTEQPGPAQLTATVADFFTTTLH